MTKLSWLPAVLRSIFSWLWRATFRLMPPSLIEYAILLACVLWMLYPWLAGRDLLHERPDPPREGQFLSQFAMLWFLSLFFVVPTTLGLAACIAIRLVVWYALPQARQQQKTHD
jgi:hypothetical protein